MHERILAVASKLPRDRPSFQLLDNHPCILRVEYNPGSRQFTLFPLEPSARKHITLSQTALRKALRGIYRTEPPVGRLVAKHDITYGSKVVGTIYTHAFRGKREVDLIHFDKNHLELLVRMIFGSDHDRSSWPIRKSTIPSQVEASKKGIENERRYA